MPSGTYGGPVPQPSLLTFNGNNNRADQWSYDAAGDVLYDLSNMYEYDAEGRQTGTLNSLNGLTGYLYDGEGRRVMKVVVTGWNTQNPTTTIENEYLLGLNGEQVSVLDGSGNWQWTNVYAGSKQLATYDSAGTHFALTDWLGSKRMELSVTGASTVTVGEQCTSLPFGDGENCTGSDVNQLHFTGKERDTESNNDYFGARYYISGMGRFLTPDWSKNPQGVPYADYTNPQSLNLYAYVDNNPLRAADPDGHVPICSDNRDGDAKCIEENNKQNQAQQQSIPTSTQRFRAADSAATAALDVVNKTSDAEHVEYGGRVVQFGPHKYAYTLAVTQGDPTGVDVDAGGKEGSRIPAGSTNAGIYHTHPSVPGHDAYRFSYADVYHATHEGVPNYVERPDGSIMKFDYGRTSSPSMYDPNKQVILRPAQY